MADDLSIDLSIDSRLENIPLLGIAVNKLCDYISFPEAESYQTELCVVEAVTNCVKHAYLNRAGNAVKVRVTISSSQIAFEIRDHGISMEKFSPKKLEFDPEDIDQLPEGGMGLFIISEYMDEVDYFQRDGLNVFRMVKCIPVKQAVSSS